MCAEPQGWDLGNLLEAIRARGAGGETLLVRRRHDGGWELKHPRQQSTASVIQADMDMATKALAIGSDLKREWQLALLFAEHREESSLAQAANSGATHRSGGDPAGA